MRGRQPGYGAREQRRGGRREARDDQAAGETITQAGQFLCQLFAVIEGYRAGIAEVTPDLPVLRSQLSPVVREVPRWSCA